uniref:Double zinc ribbon and ankyrin repeat domains 1 n=1 Tax=Cyclopterus lumpus TaxID=8103 RepID=A0A8C2XDH9_CYCLU
MLCCVFCKSLVPVNTQTCLICEASIHQQLQPQSSLTLQEHVVCVCCGSGNPAHVFSCLTCESRVQPPGHGASCVVCWRCGANGHPYAFYCAACDCSPLYEQASAPISNDATWQATPSSRPAPSTKLATPTAEQFTQTVGLYYPSGTELQRKETQRKLQLSKQQATRDCQPLLTAISPGRGFWRKKLDHLCAHLRSYAQNNAPSGLCWERPRLGRMVSAVIQEDRYEVSVTVSLVSAGARRTSGVFFSNIRTVVEGAGSGSGLGQISVIQQLLDQVRVSEGLDPSCCNSNGQHALAVALVNGHHDVLPVLVQRGADVGPNTALHEAAALGSEGLKGAQVLLSCRAGVRRRNGGGQTAYDVAVNSGCNDMVTLLAARAGLDLMAALLADTCRVTSFPMQV